MSLQDNPKPVWASKTIWGALAAIGAGLSAAIYAYQSGDTGTALTSLVSAFGGATALVGRINATSRIGKAVEGAIILADEILEDYIAHKKISKSDDQIQVNNNQTNIGS